MVPACRIKICGVNTTYQQDGQAGLPLVAHLAIVAVAIHTFAYSFKLLHLSA